MSCRDAETFAYMLMNCRWSPPLQVELTEQYYGDIIEGHMSSEDQASRPDVLWSPYEWEEVMSRIAPVQLTAGWDPRPLLLDTLKRGGASLCFRSQDDHFLYFEDLPETLPARDAAAAGPETPRDQERFLDVLGRTLELARSEGRGLLFIGGWGWTYEEDEIPPEVVPILRQAGMQFVDRHA